MSTKTKVQLLHIIALALTWVWLIATLLAIYFLLTALFIDGSWARFLTAGAIGLVAKWLYGGFEENKRRIAYEGSLVELGLSQAEAIQAWNTLLGGGPDRLRALRDERALP